ncbi:ROK family protein [Candidatus Saccharibacteria bacterium TM7i]|nr:ROK family protein [Candidatus Saccharibacteria bacterium TM7i]
MIVAIDTGGTKTLIAGYNERGAITTQYKFETPKKPSEYIDTLLTHLTALFGDKKITALSLAVPGIVRNGVAVHCPNLGWNNFPIVRELKSALGPKLPIFLENDANLAGLAEARSFRTIPDSCLYVTISTGIGSGIIIDGKIDRGLANSEAGHALIEYDGVVREWESFASGQAVYKTYKKMAKDIKSKRTWMQIADRISRGFLAVIPILQPNVIVIGGSMGSHFEKYELFLNEKLKKHLPDMIAVPKIVQAKHPEEAVVYGCYYHALDQLAAKA